MHFMIIMGKFAYYSEIQILCFEAIILNQYLQDTFDG